LPFYISAYTTLNKLLAVFFIYIIVFIADRTYKLLIRLSYNNTVVVCRPFGVCNGCIVAKR